VFFFFGIAFITGVQHFLQSCHSFVIFIFLFISNPTSPEGEELEQ
jgi:multisubunit Na+/H+ antiporter MnhG subunit